ncbi:MAG: hypothetical protein JRH06_00515 [Deltaproteobacteria bacterium]|nr:hypothetical protein [Deltaproteobacteria bacterium]MBW2136023.1 hypothetical protein [Deltaproteobacteria bacterium]
MSIKVMIERRFKENVSSEILRLIDEIRIKALRNRGYIGGETVVNIDDSREVMVISAWSNIRDWNDWYQTGTLERLGKETGPPIRGTPQDKDLHARGCLRRRGPGDIGTGKRHGFVLPVPKRVPANQCVWCADIQSLLVLLHMKCLAYLRT